MATSIMVPLLFAGVNGLLDNVPVAKIGQWEADFVAHLQSSESAIVDQIDKEGALSKDLESKIRDVITKFNSSFN